MNEKWGFYTGLYDWSLKHIVVKIFLQVIINGM